MMKRPGVIKMVCAFYWFHAFIHGLMGVLTVITTLIPAPTNLLDPHAYLGYVLSALLVISAVFLAVVGCRLWRLRPRALDLARTGSWILLAVNASAVAIALYKVREPLPPSYALAFHVLALWATSYRKVKAAVQVAN
jgi:hypothetical protein